MKTKIENRKTQIENRIIEIRKMINYNNLSESELTTLLIERNNLLKTLRSIEETEDKKEVDFEDVFESMRNAMLY